VNKVATRAAQLAKCILLHAYSRTLQLHKQKLHAAFKHSWGWKS